MTEARCGTGLYGRDRSRWSDNSRDFGLLGLAPANWPAAPPKKTFPLLVSRVLSSPSRYLPVKYAGTYGGQARRQRRRRRRNWGIRNGSFDSRKLGASDSSGLAGSVGWTTAGEDPSLS